MSLCICLPQKTLTEMAAVNVGSGEMEGSGPVFLSTVKLPLFYTLCVLSALVIVLDIACLIFFIVFRNRK